MHFWSFEISTVRHVRFAEATEALPPPSGRPGNDRSPLADPLSEAGGIPCSGKHGLIFQTFVDLAAGEHFVARNGQDPVSWHYQFENIITRAFTWENVRRLPDEVAVKTTKVKLLTGVPNAVAGSCGYH